MSKANGLPVLVLPLGLCRSAGSVCVTWLGGDITDYVAPVIGPKWATELTPEVFASLWSRIRELLPAHDVIHFERQPGMVGTCPNPMLAIGPSTVHDTNHVVDVRGDWATYYREHTSAQFRSDTSRTSRVRSRAMIRTSSTHRVGSRTWSVARESVCPVP